MQQFVIPQFIDNEDHVIGPVTTRQFLILLGTGFLVFIAYRIFYLATFAVIALIVGGMGLVLAFVRLNGRPFHYFLLNLVQTTQRPSLRVWKKQATFEEIQQDIKRSSSSSVKAAPIVVQRKPTTVSRLSELALVVDTGGVYKGEKE